MDAYLYGDSEWFCAHCAPKGAVEDPDCGGESDTPENCARCGVFLDNPLTPDGVAYVLERAENEVDEPVQSVDARIGRRLSHYDGEPHCAIVRDWLLALKGYGLSPEHRERFDQILPRIEKLYAENRPKGV